MMFTLWKANEIRQILAINVLAEVPKTVNDAEAKLARQVIGTFEGDVDLVDGQRKVARFGPFTIECDEPEAIGGSGTAPQPLHYFLASIPF